MIWIVPFEKDTDNANYPCIRYRLAAHFVQAKLTLESWRASKVSRCMLGGE